MEREIQSLPKYGQLKEIIKQEYISSLAPSERIPGIKSLMEKYKLSLTTVDRTIRDLVNEGYLYVQHGKGIFVKEKKISTKIIGIIEDYGESNLQSNFYFNNLMAGILSAATIKGYKIQHFRIDVKEAINSKIDGLILNVHPRKEEVEYVKQIKKPYCYLTNDLPDLDFNLIKFDLYEGIFNAVSYFLQAGIKEIGLLIIDDEMLNAYKDAYSKFNLNINESFIKIDKISSIHTGYKLTNELFQSEVKPKAIVFGDDYLGQGGLTALLEVKVKVPDDVGVISLANSGFLFSFPVPIATMEIDPVEIGKIVVSRVIDDTIERESRKQIIKPKFIIKESCRV